jgi:hypothetical protein
MATPSNYISVFPQIYMYAISTPHPGIGETYKPIAQSNQIFSYREMKSGCGKMFNSLAAQEKPHWQQHYH